MVSNLHDDLIYNLNRFFKGCNIITFVQSIKKLKQRGVDILRDISLNLDLNGTVEFTSRDYVSR